jgi:hypothetical protein
VRLLKHVPTKNDLNAPFSMQELEVMSQLKRNKAADLQGLGAELFVDCSIILAIVLPICQCGINI